MKFLALNVFHDQTLQIGMVMLPVTTSISDRLVSIDDFEKP